MARSAPERIPEPRVWRARQVAARFGRTVGWFTEHREALEAQGFPARDELVNGWDSKAIERWFDRRAGIPTDSALPLDKWRERRRDRHAA